MPTESRQGQEKVSIFTEYRDIIMLLCGVIIITFIFGGLIISLKGAPHSIVLPMISILGIVSLLLCLSGISYVFVKVKLDNKEQALGLPPGSIQSVIALSLVVLFAIISVFVLTTMGDAGVRSISGLKAVDRDGQIAKLGTSFAGWQEDTNGTFTLFIRDAASSARDDVGKQLIVLIGTLMTSAVSFYFGTRATVAGTAAGAAAATDPQAGRSPANPNAGPQQGADTSSSARTADNAPHSTDTPQTLRKDPKDDTSANQPATP